MTKRKYDSDSDVEEDYFPVDDHYIKRSKLKEVGKKLIVILDGAHLETVAVRISYKFNVKKIILIYHQKSSKFFWYVPILLNLVWHG